MRNTSNTSNYSYISTGNTPVLPIAMPMNTFQIPTSVITVSPRQGRLVLQSTPDPANSSLSMLDVVNNAIIASGNNDLQIWFEFASVWQSNSDILLSVANSVGLDANTITEMFIQALSL